jgi:hypothetical protein
MGLAGIGRITNDLVAAGRVRQERGQATAEQGVVVDDQDPDMVC